MAGSRSTYAAFLLVLGPLFESALSLAVVRFTAQGLGGSVARLLVAAPLLLVGGLGVASLVFSPGPLMGWIMLHFLIAMPLSLVFAFARGHQDLQVEGVAGTGGKLGLIPAVLWSVQGEASAVGAARALVMASTLGWILLLPFLPRMVGRWRRRGSDTGPVASELFVLSTVAFTSLMMLRAPLFGLEALTGGAVVGVFATAQRIVEIGFVAPQAVMLALFPVLAAGRRPPSSIGARMFAGGVASALLITGAAVWVVPRAYPDGSGIVALVVQTAPAIPAVFLGSLFTQMLLARGRARAWLAATVAGATVAIVGVMTMVPLAGASGAAWATVMAEWTVAGLSYWLLRPSPADPAPPEPAPRGPAAP